MAALRPLLALLVAVLWLLVSPGVQAWASIGTLVWPVEAAASAERELASTPSETPDPLEDTDLDDTEGSGEDGESEEQAASFDESQWGAEDQVRSLMVARSERGSTHATDPPLPPPRVHSSRTE